MLWSEESVYRACEENVVMTFPDQKRINIELYTDGTAALYIKGAGIRDATNEGDQQVDTR